MSYLHTTSDGAILRIRVVPRASRNEICGRHDQSLKIRLQAPPVDDKANQALLRFLADALDLPPGALRLLSGDTGRNKQVLVAGLSAEAVRSRLGD